MQLGIGTTVDFLPNFEDVPYFEHYVNKGCSNPTTYKLINLIHKDVFRLVNEIKKPFSLTKINGA